MSESRRSIGQCPKYSLFQGNTAISRTEFNLRADDDEERGDDDDDRDEERGDGGDEDGGGEVWAFGRRSAICWPHLISGPHGSSPLHAAKIRRGEKRRGSGVDSPSLGPLRADAVGNG